MVKNPVRTLGQEGPLEEKMATHSSVLAWKIPWTEEPGELHSTGSKRVRQLKRLSTNARMVDNTLENLRNGQQPLEGSQALGDAELSRGFPGGASGK